MAYRLAPEAEADLEGIAFYVFVDSGSLEIPDRLIQSIAERFELAFRLANTFSCTESNVRVSQFFVS